MLVVLAFSLALCLLLDALEILFLVVPLAMPTLLALGGDPVWLAVLFAITIQTGFMMPPSGFAICFLRSVAPPEVRTGEIYAGVAPILVLQAAVIALMWIFPAFVTWLRAMHDALNRLQVHGRRKVRQRVVRCIRTPDGRG